MENTQINNNEHEIDDILEGLRTATTQEERRAILERLIERRGQLRSTRETKLRADTTRAQKAIHKAKNAALEEEVAWFKDVLKIHRRLTKEHGPPRD